MPDIVKESVEGVFFIPPISVAATATVLAIPALPHSPQKGVLIKAPGAGDDDPNTLSVFLGRAGVTADQGALGGFPLAPGESIVLPLSAFGDIYVIAADANQKLNCIVI